MNSYTNEELKNELQNLPWDTIMFAFSTYYQKKTYLSELIQVVQLLIWKIAAKLGSLFYECGSGFLDHSLSENPSDIHIVEGTLVEKIKHDVKFKKKWKKL